jgi:hypothetical protein
MTIKRLILTLLLVAAAALHAEEPARFFVERIDVRGIRRVSRDVVVAESLLREGTSYSEQDLREGSLRVNRAPYLISADFSLEKGSERGKYVLVITVNETRPFFYVLDGIYYPPRAKYTHIDYVNNLTPDDNDVAVGFRFFVGPRGAIHFGFQGTADNRPYTVDYSALAVGYTQYDLFGTRAFATLNLKTPLGYHATASTVAPQLVLGVPLSLDQTLTLDYDQIDIDLVRSIGDSHQTQRVFTAKWSYNTTNHPVLPTRGVLFTITPVAVWNTQKGGDITSVVPRRVIPFEIHDRSFGLEGSAARYWELDDRNSVSAAAGLGYAQTHGSGVRIAAGRFGDRNVNSSFATIDLSIAHSFWSPERVAKDGDSRIALDVHLGRHVDDTRVPAYFRDFNARQANVDWVRRNAWGTARFGVGYAW